VNEIADEKIMSFLRTYE